VAKTAGGLSALPAMLAVAAVAGCGGKGGNSAGQSASGIPAELPAQLFPDDFKGVCSGASASAASAYDAAGKAHKALYFATYKDDMSDHSSSLPADWTVQYAARGDPFKAIDLVVCARRTAAREVRVCDKYQKDGKPSQNKIRWHTATYELTLREAKTGRQLDRKSVEATDTECPMLIFTSDSEGTVDDYASLSNTAVTDFLRPHMGH